MNDVAEYASGQRVILRLIRREVDQLATDVFRFN
jgi:hypothetical protein